MSFIQSYKKFLDEQRNNLITNQFNSFIENNNIDSSAKLKKSFLKLVNLLDNDLNLKNLNDTTFIFDS